MNPHRDSHLRPQPKLRISDLGPQELKLVTDVFLIGSIIGGFVGLLIAHFIR